MRMKGSAGNRLDVQTMQRHDALSSGAAGVAQVQPAKQRLRPCRQVLRSNHLVERILAPK